jgi:hypothetical protein
MRRQEDPSEMRRWSATEVLDGSAKLDDYPHRYVFVYADQTMKTFRNAMPRLLAAVEALEDHGWELVTILGKETFYAVMRRPSA